MAKDEPAILVIVFRHDGSRSHWDGLRWLLKTALRVYGLRCLKIEGAANEVVDVETLRLARPVHPGSDHYRLVRAGPDRDSSGLFDDHRSGFRRR